MKAGRDVDGFWTLLESSMWYVPTRVQSGCDNLSHWQGLCRLVAHSMGYPPSPFYLEKKLHSSACSTIWQRTDPRAVADGRK
jgi:hypothetical protein